MKAKIAPRITLKGRTKLETVIPLSTPYLVFLDPSDICNFRCRFCPTGDRDLIRSVRKPQLMTFDLYIKIIDDLATMPEPIKVLRLYSDGEPLLNPHLPGMIRYAKDSGRFLQVDTTTNGSLFSPWLSKRLIGAGLDKIFISVNGLSDAAYWKFTGYRLKFGQFVKGIRHFYKNRRNCEMTVKIVGDNLSEQERGKFYEIFGNICDHIFIEYTAPCWPGFEVEGVNQEKGIYGQPIKEVQVCPYIFYSLKINSDGSVSLCFLDWKHNMILGDLKTEHFKEVWGSITLKAIRLLNLNGKRKDVLMCGSCGQLKYGQPDDIDQYVQEILRRLK